MIIVRQSTARTVTVGPVLDSSGAAVTTAVVGDFKISKNGGAPAALNGSATLTHRNTGHYSLALTASDCDTVGQAEVVIDATTNACPVKELTVVEEAVYDAFFAASAVGYVANAPVTLADGVAHGGTLGSSTATLALSRLSVVSQTSNTAAVTATGNGSGAGILSTGGSTGHGVNCVGGGPTANGFRAAATTSGHGMVLAGAGSFHGLSATGGASSGNGISCSGNGGGDGFTATGGSGGSGASFSGASTGHGITTSGGSTGGTGFRCVGGSASGSTAAGPGISATGGAASTGGSAVAAPGVRVVGGAGAASTNGAAAGATFAGGGTNTVASTASGIVITGTSTGDGVTATSGSGSTGNGMTLTAASTNGHGLKATGTGTGDGFELTAGASGADLDADVTGNVTGNLSGSVGSVVGAVGSVTGNVGGNVVGSVASVVGAVGSVTGNVGGNVTGTVGGMTAAGMALMFTTDTTKTYADAVAGSVVKEIADNASGGGGDPWTTALPGSYTAGQAGYILGTNLDAAVSSRASQTSVDDLPTNAELATALDALPTAAENATAVWGEATRTLTAGTNIVLAKGVGVTGFTDLSAADVRAAVGLATNNLDTQLAALATAIDATPTNAELNARTLLAADYATAASISALNDLSPAEVNAQVLDVLTVDTFAELGGVPAATATLADKLGWLFMLGRNQIDQDATTFNVYSDGAAGVIATAACSDDTTTTTRGELS